MSKSSSCGACECVCAFLKTAVGICSVVVATPLVIGAAAWTYDGISHLGSSINRAAGSAAFNLSSDTSPYLSASPYRPVDEREPLVTDTTSPSTAQADYSSYSTTEVAYGTAQGKISTVKISAICDVDPVVKRHTNSVSLSLYDSKGVEVARAYTPENAGDALQVMLPKEFDRSDEKLDVSDSEIELDFHNGNVGVSLVPTSALKNTEPGNNRSAFLVTLHPSQKSMLSNSDIATIASKAGFSESKLCVAGSESDHPNRSEVQAVAQRIMKGVEHNAL